MLGTCVTYQARPTATDVEEFIHQKSEMYKALNATQISVLPNYAKEEERLRLTYKHIFERQPNLNEEKIGTARQFQAVMSTPTRTRKDFQHIVEMGESLRVFLLTRSRNYKFIF